MRVEKVYYYNDVIIDELKFFDRLIQLSSSPKTKLIDNTLLLYRLTELMKGNTIRIAINFNKNSLYSPPLLYYYFKIGFIIVRD